MQKACIVFIISLFLVACTTIRPIEYQHGKQFFDSGNYKAAIRLLLPVAAEGNCRAQYAVGYIYYYGLVGSIDYESGLFWIKKAAKQHYPPAVRALKIIHQDYQHELHEKAKTPLSSSLHPKISSYGESLLALKNLSIVPTNHYSLQLLGDYDLDSLKKIASKLNLEGETFYGKTLRNKHDWYMLLYGDYKAPYLAKLAEMDLPASLRQFKPSIRKTDQIVRVV